MTCEAMHLQMLQDNHPENERAGLDPDHWYEINLTNASLFSNLYLEDVPGLEQLVPGRLFTTRMPRKIEEDLNERAEFINKCQKNDLQVVLVLTEAFEFQKYCCTSDWLFNFYTSRCSLQVYNRAIPDFQIPTSGELVANILDLVYHLSQGQNCLVHCAGGTGRTGMVVAAIVQNLGVYDALAKVRKVKSTYVETHEQELFLKNMPRAIDKRIVKEKPHLAKAIAAEHLIQVFHTHGENIERTNSEEEKEAVRQKMGESIMDEEKNLLLNAYKETFELIDQDKSGVLEETELREWFRMCNSELDLTKLTEVLVGEGALTKDKFAKLMSSNAKSSRRQYDPVVEQQEKHSKNIMWDIV